jgi:hypothetical protein
MNKQRENKVKQFFHWGSMLCAVCCLFYARAVVQAHVQPLRESVQAHQHVDQFLTALRQENEGVAISILQNDRLDNHYLEQKIKSSMPQETLNYGMDTTLSARYRLLKSGDRIRLRLTDTKSLQLKNLWVYGEVCGISKNMLP